MRNCACSILIRACILWVVPKIIILATFFFAATTDPIELYSYLTDYYATTIFTVVTMLIVSIVFIWTLISFMPFLLTSTTNYL